MMVHVFRYEKHCPEKHLGSVEASVVVGLVFNSGCEDLGVLAIWDGMVWLLVL